jgi:hypothetical protein
MLATVLKTPDCSKVEFALGSEKGTSTLKSPRLHICSGFYSITMICCAAKCKSRRSLMWGVSIEVCRTRPEAWREGYLTPSVA